MFSAVLRNAARPVLASARPSMRVAAPAVKKALSTSAVRRSGPAGPSLFGPGGQPGQVPSDEDQSTGLERLQLLGELEGVDIFDRDALDSSRVGTPSDPIKVLSLVRSEHVI
jgi:cytochrome c oxidase subunit 5b